MKTYTLTRIDKYSVDVQARSLKEALRKAEDDEQYLNGGIFYGSSFEVE